jgi:LacI family transcriptional regulator
MTDVALAAGVSQTTVSFVLSGRPNAGIPEETAERVRAAVAELGYRHNAAARALASSRTHLIGVVTDVVTSPFAGDAVLGAQSRAWASGFQVLITSVEHQPTLDHEPFDVLMGRQIEALAVIMTTNRRMRLPRDVQFLPTVIVNSLDEDGLVPSVVPDEEAGGREAVEHLIGLGHRRIAMINLEPDRIAAIGRRAGYEAALRGAGIILDPALVHEGPADARHGFEAMRRLLGAADRPTAVFCATDRIAMGAYDAIKETGLRIPEDVSVVGFDDQEILTEFLRPTLTTMRLPFREMADRAVELLAQQLEDPDAAVISERVRCPLIERNSVRPPISQIPPGERTLPDGT